MEMFQTLYVTVNLSVKFLGFVWDYIGLEHGFQI